MTADVELLPLPEALFETGSRRDLFNVAQMEGYARAVAEHNVSRERDRAERLAVALRMMVENADDLVAYRHDEDDIGDRPCCQVASYEPHADHCPTHIARAALRDHDQEGGNP